jgi:ABC-type transporter Mla maintaining outer membrane lipid asymmetry ATPase subunit MlaF
MGTPEIIQKSTHPVVRQFISGSLEGPIHLMHRTPKQKKIDYDILNNR